MDIFVPILKVDAAKREVYGVMAEDVKDKAGETFDYVTSKPYVKAWSEEALNRTLNAGQEISLGNVRAQHSQVAAGKLVDIQFDDKAKRIPVIAKIVDDNEWKKVLDGVYTGFSVGGSYVKRWADGATIRYTANPREVSIVDNPCMYGATFSLVKANGASEYRSFAGAPSSELAVLRIQVRAQMDELLVKINGLLESRAAAPRSVRFNTSGVEKSDAAEQELQKARSNSRLVTFQDFGSAEPAKTPVVERTENRPFQPGGIHKADAASTELQKALASGKPVGFSLRD